MKFVDRVPTKANYRKITNVDTGEEITAQVEYADEPTTTGTPLNANNLNQITNDIVSQINSSPLTIVRDVNGGIIIDEKNIVEDKKIAVGNITANNTEKTIDIQNTLEIKKFNFWQFGMKIKQDSLKNKEIYVSSSILINGNTYATFSNSFCLNSSLTSDVYIPSVALETFKMYDFNETVNVTYRLKYYLKNDSITINDLYIIPLYRNEKRVILKGAE